MEPDETQSVQDSDSTDASETPGDHIHEAKHRLTDAANGLHADEDAGATLANNRVRKAIAMCNDALAFLDDDGADEEAGA